MSLRSIALYVVTLAIGSTFLIGGITLPAKAADKAVLVIHGGAGVEAGLTDLEQENYKKGLKEAFVPAHDQHSGVM